MTGVSQLWCGCMFDMDQGQFNIPQPGKLLSKEFFQIRNPGDDEIIEMNTIMPELRDRIVAAADVRIIDRKEHI